ncbi:MAG TPA: ABC transporter permease [Casimicrobiaceae bacterium]|nr:ABC transporter permease [Casimicrobiaceae bacterium]
MPALVIEVRDVTRLYRLGVEEVHALDGVSLTIEKGAFVAIMGSSGSGKSTLMNILGCLDRPTSGRYLFEGRDVAGLPEPELARIRSERIGFVFQSFNLLPRTSTIDNVALPLFYAPGGPVRRAERIARARASLRMLGLADRERNTPAQLSGGQQQRAAIARALINHPAVLLADEPTGNLDTRTSHEIMDTLRVLNRQQAVTVVVVTHEPDIAAYADRTVTMRDGRIQSDTTNVPNAGPGQEIAADASISSAPRRETHAASRTASVWRFLAMTLIAAAQALGRNTMRSILTMLGVFIGVAALIAMVAVGRGADEAVRKQIESLGTNLLIVLPGATTSGGVRAGFGSASTLTVADAQAIRRDAPAVAEVSYMIRQLGQTQYGNQNWTTSIQGVTPSYLGATNWQIAQGRALTADDDAGSEVVCLIGQTVYQQLFAPGENPIGATILIKGTPARVIALLASKGQSAFGQDQDDLVIVPFTPAERKVLGVAAPSQAQSPLAAMYPPPPNPYGTPPRLTGYVNQIYVQAAGPDLVNAAITQVTEVLTQRHHIRAGQTADFAVRNLSQIAEAAEGSSRIMALLLATVASISLVVGGIGIMNILLVSVTERTREIGLRMAIGARRLQVLLQFLIEAILLSVIGGCAGILAGIVVSDLISIIAHWPTQLSSAAIVGGFAFSAAVGIFFGYYPARKASHLDPIEALRYE